MAHPWHHSERSARLFGGKAEDYLSIHDWFDESKAHLPDVRHRALRHHSEGIFLCESIFGTTLTNSAGRVIPVRLIGEQHVKDDLGWIPTVKDWLINLQVQPWMVRTPFRASHLETEREPAVPTECQTENREPTSEDEQPHSVEMDLSRNQPPDVILKE